MDKRLLAELEWIAFETDTPLDQVLEDFNRKDTSKREVGTSSLDSIYKSDTPGQSSSSSTLNIIKRIAREKGRSAKVNKKNYEPQLNKGYVHD